MLYLNNFNQVLNKKFSWFLALNSAHGKVAETLYIQQHSYQIEKKSVCMQFVMKS